MKTPNKIYAREYQDGYYSTWWDEKPHEEESIGMKAVCYIRKDTLIGWANEKLEGLKALLVTDPYKEVYVGQCEVYKELIDKLNSM